MPEATLLLAESLHELGAYDEAERLFTESSPELLTADDDLRVLLLEMRARNLFWGLQRLDDAIALYHSANETIDSATMREELVIDEGMALAMTGRPVDALTLIADVPGSTPRARVLRGLVEVPALVLTGKCDTAGRIARRIYVEHEELGDHATVAHPGLHMIHLMMALLDAGRFEEASRLGEAAYRVAIGVGAPAGRVWWSYGIGRAALMSGSVQSALRWLGEAAGLSHGRFHGQHRIILSLLAACRAHLGDAAGARAAVDEIDSLPPFAYRAGEQEIGRAWAAVSVGDLEGARSVLLERRATWRRPVRLHKRLGYGTKWPAWVKRPPYANGSTSSRRSARAISSLRMPPTRERRRAGRPEASVPRPTDSKRWARDCWRPKPQPAQPTRTAGAATAAQRRRWRRVRRPFGRCVKERARPRS